MKQLIIALALSFTALTASAETATLCGVYRMDSSDGMLTVVRNYLEVSSGPMTPAFEEYELSSAGETFAEVEDASNLIGSLVVGKSYCIKGEVYQKPNYDMVLIPDEVVPYTGK